MDQISAAVDAARDAAMARMHDADELAQAIDDTAHAVARRIVEEPLNLVGHFEDRATPWCDVRVGGQALDLRVAELLAAALDLRAHDSRLAMHLRSLAADLIDTIAADADIRAQAEQAHAPIAEPADYGYDCATCHISDEDWS